MMQVSAALPWYDESPEDLYKCVRATANVADRIVALDGGYYRYPGAKPTSPPEQADAIRQAANDASLDCLVVQLDRVWMGQIEKRTHLLTLAAINSAWVVCVDADHIIHTNRKDIRHELENISEEVMVLKVPYWTPPNNGKPIEKVASGQWHAEMAGTHEMIPHIFRALPGMRVERFHWWYSAINKQGDRVWLWTAHGNSDHYVPVPHHAVQCDYHVEHRCLFRAKKQMLANRAFCNDREWVVSETGQEDHVLGLPLPVPDYERMSA